MNFIIKNAEWTIKRKISKRCFSNGRVSCFHCKISNRESDRHTVTEECRVANLCKNLSNANKQANTCIIRCMQCRTTTASESCCLETRGLVGNIALKIHRHSDPSAWRPAHNSALLTYHSCTAPTLQLLCGAEVVRKQEQWDKARKLLETWQSCTVIIMWQ